MDTLVKEKAIDTLKSNLHLPGNGFHSLIVELSRTYQLPFQTVRKALKEAQVSIETQIRNGTGTPRQECLTREHWQSIAETVLASKVAGRVPVIERIKSGSDYCEALKIVEQANSSVSDRELAGAKLATVYDAEVYQPLRAMLYTTHIIWKLKEDLSDMTEEEWAVFKDYPEYVDAALLLLKQKERLRNR